MWHGQSKTTLAGLRGGGARGDTWTKEEDEQGSDPEVMLPGHRRGDGFSHHASDGM